MDHLANVAFGLLPHSVHPNALRSPAAVAPSAHRGRGPIPALVKYAGSSRAETASRQPELTLFKSHQFFPSAATDGAAVHEFMVKGEHRTNMYQPTLFIFKEHACLPSPTKSGRAHSHERQGAKHHQALVCLIPIGNEQKAKYTRQQHNRRTAYRLRIHGGPLT